MKLGSDSETSGIISLTKNSITGDPKIHYIVADGSIDAGAPKAGLQPSNSVDLLWGVSSGFSYHPVNGQEETSTTPGDAEIIVKEAGLPVEHMYKPALDEKIKFDFKHALARIGMTVVGAFDQKAQGGSLDQNTKVTIKSITVKGKFYTEGVLNLDNTTANVALWSKDASGTAFDGTDKTITVSNLGEMNPELKYYIKTADAGKFPAVAGVIATERNVIVKDTTYTEATSPVYDGVTTYFTEATGVYTPAAPTWPSNTYYEYKYNASTKVYTLVTTAGEFGDGKTNTYYEIVPGSAINETTAKATDKDLYKYDGTEKTYTLSPKAVKDSRSGDNYYDIKVSAAKPQYTGTVYTMKANPSYFMVIPDPANAGKDLDVEVEIDYFVTTADRKLPDPFTSEVENKIKQTVTLKEFTNGKAYNLKLILGLTSVKVDAEVSNWEVGTVESNLPQNLE